MKKITALIVATIVAFLLVNIVAPKAAEACARVLGKTDTHVKVAIEGSCSLMTVSRMFPQIDPETKQQLSVMDGVRSMYADKLNQKTVKYSCIKGKPSGWTLTPDEEKMCAKRGEGYYPNYWGIASVGNIMPIYVPRTRQLTEVDQLRKENAKLKALLEQYKKGAPPVEIAKAVVDSREMQILEMKLGAAQEAIAFEKASNQKAQSIAMGIGSLMLTVIAFLSVVLYRMRRRMQCQMDFQRISRAQTDRFAEHQKCVQSEMLKQAQELEEANQELEEANKGLQSKLQDLREEKAQADAELMHQAERAILAESLLAERERRVRRLHVEMDAVAQERDEVKETVKEVTNQVKELTEQVDRLEVERMMLHSNLRKFESSSSTEKNEKVIYSTENVDDGEMEIEFNLNSPPVGSGEWMLLEIERELEKDNTTPEDRECLTDLRTQLRATPPEESEKVVCDGLEKMDLVRSFWRKEGAATSVAET